MKVCFKIVRRKEPWVGKSRHRILLDFYRSSHVHLHLELSAPLILSEFQWELKALRDENSDSEIKKGANNFCSYPFGSSVTHNNSNMDNLSKLEALLGEREKSKEDIDWDQFTHAKPKHSKSF